MKKEDVHVGCAYRAKVSGQVVPVRITAERWVGSEHKGWNAVNTATGRPVLIKSAQRLRSAVGDDAGVADAAAAFGAADAAQAADAGNAAETVVAGPVGSPRPPKGKKAAAPKAGKSAPAKPAATKPAPAKPAAAKPSAKQPAKAAKPAPAGGARKMSALNAAHAVLAEAGEPMPVKTLIARMADKGLWTSPGGKTPHSTLAAALMRDIAAKGRDSRFKKADRGLYAASGRGA